MRFQLLALTIAASLAATPSFAGDGKDGGYVKGGHGKGGLRRVFCPHCGDACYPTVTKGTETKYCWNVDTKAICIPKVRFPWEAKCCNKGCGKDGCVTPKCGRTKEVNVLVKHEYECSVCKYSWDPNSFKNGQGDNKYKAGPTPADDGPSVASPPTIEARWQIPRQAPMPARFEPPVPAEASAFAPHQRSYGEIRTASRKFRRLPN